MQFNIFANFGSIDGRARFVFCLNDKAEEIGKVDISRKVHSLRHFFRLFVYSGHALSYTKLVHGHATQTEGNKYFK